LINNPLITETMKKGNNTTQKSSFGETDSLVNMATGSAAGFISLFTVTVLILLSMLLQQ